MAALPAVLIGLESDRVDRLAVEVGDDVPAALLELDDKNAVIRAQVPSAVAILVANIFLLYFLM